jgi:hypothetical protein
MNSREQIASLLKEWGRLTEAEGRAIEAGSWNNLANAQADKRSLQSKLSELLANEENSSGGDFKSDFKPEVRRLLSMESQNANLLSAAIEKVREIQGGLEKTARDLRRVQGSYGMKREGVWNSYS